MSVASFSTSLKRITGLSFPLSRFDFSKAIDVTTVNRGKMPSTYNAWGVRGGAWGKARTSHRF
jgi:hypothetical protein